MKVQGTHRQLRVCWPTIESIHLQFVVHWQNVGPDISLHPSSTGVTRPVESQMPSDCCISQRQTERELSTTCRATQRYCSTWTESASHPVVDLHRHRQMISIETGDSRVNVRISHLYDKFRQSESCRCVGRQCRPLPANRCCRWVALYDTDDKSIQDFGRPSTWPLPSLCQHSHRDTNRDIGRN